MLQSSRLKYHMNNIGIDKSVRNRASFEHNFLNNMKNIYQHAGKCADPQKNDILGDTMVSTPEEITYYSPILPMNQTKIKKTSAKNHCVYSPTYLVLKRELISVMMELQNQNAEPLNMDVACEQIKQNGKCIQKSMNILNVSFVIG